jgi:membrane-associated phospholipid phosphatase
LELTQCQGLDDETSCANLVDSEGNVASCIQSSCGYQLFDGFELSVAGTSDPYDASEANNPKSSLSVISLFYSLVPYLMVFIYSLSFLITGNIVPLTRLLVLGILALINEAIVKQFVQQSRPVGSCLYFKSFGMPSGHSASSIGLLTYLLLEIFLFHPNLMCGLTCQKQRHGDEIYYFAWGCGWQKRKKHDTIGINNAPNTPLSADIELGLNHNMAIAMNENEEDNSSPTNRDSANFLQGRWTYHLYAFFYCLLLLPVPFSRVYLHDHSKEQVLFGSIEGILGASFWYLCVIRMIGVRFMKWWSKSSCAKWFGLKFG